MDELKIRKTEKNDLEYVLLNERDSENSSYVDQWSYNEHLKSLDNKNILHFIIEKNNLKIGYIIISGIERGKNIEIKRLVISEKNNGYGRKILKILKEILFYDYKANRVWLDTRLNNKRAIHLYKTEGFQEEGILRESIETRTGYESIMILSILKKEYLPEIKYIKKPLLKREEFMELYSSVDWARYSKIAFESLEDSLYYIGAYFNDRLIGFIRTLGDGKTGIIIQDLLIDEKYRRKGIGKKLVNLILELAPKECSITLLTDDGIDTINFYKSLNFIDIKDKKMIGFIKKNTNS